MKSLVRKTTSRTGIAAAAVGLCCVIAAPPEAFAEEGMYFPFDLSKAPVAKLRKGSRGGLQLSKDQIKQLSFAVVQLARGGTGSFVSSKGLVVTNHHVAFRCLAALDGSTHEGIMKKGYVASSMKDELPCPNYELRVVEDLSDVTEKVFEGLKPKMSYRKRFRALLRRKREIESQCEEGHPDRVCEVREVNGATAYTLSIHRRINDVRLVYAPEKALGKYGGDVDNWRYPRHTADFTFLRAYVSPTGRAADYSKSNVAYKPKKHLKVSTAGVRRDGLNMVIGFPGRTMRHSTYYRARYNRKHHMPYKKKLFTRILAALPKKGLSARRYQGLEAGLSNAVKYYSDVTRLFDRFDVLKDKKREVAKWKKKIAADPRLRAEHGELLKKIGSIYDELSRRFKPPLIVHYLTSGLVRSVRTAYDIVKWNRLKGVADHRREDDRYRRSNEKQLLRGSRFLERSTTATGEKALVTALLKAASKLSPKKRPRALGWLERWTKDKRSFLERRARKRSVPYDKVFSKVAGVAPTGDPIADGVALVYAYTRLYGGPGKKARKRSSRLRKRLFNRSYRAIRRSKDPLLRLAVKLDQDKQRYKRTVFFDLEKVLHPVLWPVLVKKVIQPRYLDANFTQRVAFGRVKDYTDTVKNKKWRYVSRLTWLVRRDKGKYPFIVPERVKQAYAKRDFGPWKDPVIGDVPVNFTSTLDTTGGNSGSPVMNGKGELVGLLFDGTPESMLSDWTYLPNAQRSICVDIRFVLFLADKVHGAKRVLRELGVVESPEQQ
jgi:hypothetical protein